MFTRLVKKSLAGEYLMRLIYNLNCIKAPMTGVAYYTMNMVLSIIKAYPNIDIQAFYHHKLLSKKEILALFSKTRMESQPESKLKQVLIQMINQCYFARQIIQYKENIHHRLYLKSHLNQALYHEPNFVFLAHQGKKILTVHDLSMFDCPEFLPKGRAKFLQYHMKRSIKAANALIVSCQFIKNQLLTLFDLDEKKIHVISPGAEPGFKPRTVIETQASLEKFSLNYKKFLLCVATLEPRKNIASLIQAYQHIPIELQKEYPLILIGNKGWMYQDLMALIHEKKDAKIKLLTYVDEKNLLNLYSSAKAFIYPSLYEGFGLPVLEAMQSGLPVITSNTSSLPEVAGEAGFLINPQDQQEITDAIVQLLNIKESDYAALVNKTIHSAKAFSWEKLAHQLMEVYTLL